MSGFSPELKNQIKYENNYRCQILKLEVDVLEAHHCLPKSLGGSNNRVNLVELAGQNAYCAYGVPVEDVHEKFDQLALKERLFYDTKSGEFVTYDKLDIGCFKNGIQEIRETKGKKCKHKHKKHNNR